MSNSETAEMYFITAMMILILIICAVATYYFFKTFYAEKRDREIRLKNKAEAEAEIKKAEVKS